MDVTHTTMDSPLGELTLVGNDGALAGVYFAGQRNRPRPGRLGRRAPAELAEPVRQLGEYFAGLDVSLETVNVCIVNAAGDILLEKKIAASQQPLFIC